MSTAASMMTDIDKTPDVSSVETVMAGDDLVDAVAARLTAAMATNMLTVADPNEPAACTTMAEVRAGVDALDRDLVALLRRRFDYMDAAARIKPARAAVRDEARKAEVIANARAAAEERGLAGDVIADLWERLVEASIAYELAAFDRTRG